jgi:hypothetical protein
VKMRLDSRSACYSTLWHRVLCCTVMLQSCFLMHVLPVYFYVHAPSVLCDQKLHQTCRSASLNIISLQERDSDNFRIIIVVMGIPFEMRRHF